MSSVRVFPGKTEMDSRLITVTDLADRFQVRPETIKRWEKDGRLPKALRIGVKWYWRHDQLSTFLGE